MPGTKRVNAYGKRSSRIVYVSDHDPEGSPLASHHTLVHSPHSAPKGRILPRKVHGLSTSPRGSPKSGNVLGKTALKDTTTPRRRPLIPKVANVLDSPSIIYLGDRVMTSPTKGSRFTPFLDSKAVVVQEPRVTVGGNVTENSSYNEESEVVRPSRKRAQKKTIIVTDDEEGHKRVTKRTLQGTQVNPIIVSDYSSDDHSAITMVSKTRGTRAPKLLLEQQPPKTAVRRTEVKKCLPIVPKSSSARVPHPPSPAVARPFSSRRSQRNVLLPSKSQNHAQPMALASESKLEPTGVRPKQKQKLNDKSVKRTTAHQQHLAPLLAECGQEMPHCFSTFIDMFPFHDIHGQNPPATLAFRKIGEASFSEVFAIGNVVLKIVPLRNESAAGDAVDPVLDMPPESDATDVCQEVIVTRTLGQICRGFVRLLRAYVVRGAYPTLLLSLWDGFHSAKGSENIRPGIFPSTQAYAVLVLPHGGPDLEAYTFPVKTGWRQACSIFWQTAKALAIAEDLVSFEHRDLHWGQILVGSTVSTRKLAPRALVQDPSQIVRLSMDDPSHGVTVTIIDLGLARMNAGDGVQTSVHWTNFDELTFEGEGDYQFDVYRMMQGVHGDTWDQYRPVTNVMWLHYLLSKLLHAKRLRRPGKRGVPPNNQYNEKECYECLLDMEHRLRTSILFIGSKKGRGGCVKGSFRKAEDVVEFARGRGWVS